MKRVSRTASVTLELAPLIDIVFILLIFFVVTSAAIDEVTLEIDLPDVAASSGASVAAETILVVINADDQIFLGEDLVLDTSTQALANQVKSLRNNLASVAVEIRADENARHASVVRVFDAMNLLGLTRINLITERQESE